ncbi:MAG: hypothetical protein WAZ98_00935, partial [Cyclobacteriaceae bacterium]
NPHKKKSPDRLSGLFQRLKNVPPQAGLIKRHCGTGKKYLPPTTTTNGVKYQTHRKCHTFELVEIINRISIFFILIRLLSQGLSVRN